MPENREKPNWSNWSNAPLRKSGGKLRLARFLLRARTLPPLRPFQGLRGRETRVGTHARTLARASDLGFGFRQPDRRNERLAARRTHRDRGDEAPAAPLRPASRISRRASRGVHPSSLCRRGESSELSGDMLRRRHSDEGRSQPDHRQSRTPRHRQARRSAWQQSKDRAVKRQSANLRRGFSMINGLPGW